MKHQEENQTEFNEMTRRSFLRTAGTAVGAMAAVSVTAPYNAEAQNAFSAEQTGAHRAGKVSPKPSSFLDLLRTPDEVAAFGIFEKSLPAGKIPMTRRGEEWIGRQVLI